MIPRSKIVASFCISLPIFFGMAISANAQIPIGEPGKILVHCEKPDEKDKEKKKERECNRKLTLDTTTGNYLFEQTKDTNDCENQKIPDETKDASGKPKADLPCKCRIIGKYDAAKANKKAAKGVTYDYKDHVDGDEAAIGISTITKDLYAELKDHGWDISIGCIAVSINTPVYVKKP
jgi:hypothetical protein